MHEYYQDYKILHNFLVVVGFELRALCLPVGTLPLETPGSSQDAFYISNEFVFLSYDGCKIGDLKTTKI
jgi:hypothetical protein